MKCIHCGKEIHSGSVYCEHCGKSAQIVPDYNILEDEIISSYIDPALSPKESPVEVPVTTEKKKNIFKKLWGRKKLRIAMILSWIVIVLLIVFFAYRFQTSYGHQMSLAQECDGNKEYKEAITHYQKAISANSDSVKARCGMGQDYIFLEQYQDAETILLEAVDIDSSDTKVFKLLLEVYIKLEDYDKIYQLEDMTEDKKVLALFQEYVVAPPVFSLDEGEYTDDIVLEFSADAFVDVYYTLNGQDPASSQGIKYQEPIEIKDGTTKVKACGKNSDGSYSQVITKTYTVTYKNPDYAVVSPASGTYTQPTQITMEAVDQASIFYTWDGSVPSASSNRYTGPIPMLEGNNVLSVLVIDKHGLCSDILRCNYKYMP